MRFQFDPHQPYQASAIEAVTDLFDGQPADADQLVTTFRLLPSEPALFDRAEVSGQVSLDIAAEVGAVGNNLVLDEDTILANLQRVQDRNGLESAQALADGLQFDVEMETGTGKTYVYLRTAFELAKRYRFTKFIILVPSVAIREGVKTSIDLMREHFRHLYPEINMDASVYAGERAEEVRDFASATSLQFLVMTIDSLRGDKNTRIMYQNRDKLAGLRPLDYLRATRPIVIMDEPQNMESMLAQSAVADLDPLCTLRYSATHRVTRNVVYRLDPLDAHQLGLVKTIVVSDAQELGGSAKPYVKLLRVSRDPFKASLELVCRKKDGSYAKRKVIAAQGDDLERISGGNPAYEGNWRVSEISVEPERIELSNYGYLSVGDEIGSNQDAVFREMIRETIREHIRKELQVHARGIKVLSLFFIDKVASYLGDGINNLDANGDFATWFDELYTEELDRQPEARDIMPATALDARSGYFAQMKSGKGKNAVMTFKDSSGKTKADDDAYELIMRDKARLLSMDEPVRFIFSHSALREGWDNPNVFQICTLRDMASETERRQTIGRGLRLPVNQDGERISDTGLAQLTVVSNESYKAFASALQNEYQKAGVAIGFVRKQEFSRLPITVDGKETALGAKRSAEIWDHLHRRGFINEQGEVQGSWGPEQLGFTVDLPEPYAEYEDDVINIVNACKMETIIKRKRKRVARKLNKELYAAPGFEEFWDKITQRTTYRVNFERQALVDACVNRIKTAPRTEPIRIQVTRTKMTMTRGGTKGNTLGSRGADLTGSYPLPDIVAQLQEATSLTRRTIIDILIGSGRLGEFLGNPNDFIKMATVCIQEELAHVVVEGIQYEKIGGSIYELRELQEDGLEEKDRFLDQLYKVTNTDKTDFDYVVFDSAVERQFAEYLDGLEDIRLFMKLPNKFRIPTPVGDYNPDWAIIKTEDGQDRLYLIRETKSSLDPTKRRPGENAKINAAIKHFEAIGVNYKVAAPDNWGL
ncbi:DEAD/DEAH box helicase family protein [Schaalia odontolytica]|uniref:Restriction endonuclease n=2 Tax=Schaalia odontolytica TaxID=1660 RepID=A0A857ABD0_9ACTO|nr:DEAD/DEAH box helicase family protein [Schaalia odontolytica]EFF79712.1 type III restriction enzyme, res subunit [Schaalia odontolytica F0309]QGS11816.1 restriction endonuclease [Schaalia odontolytica]